MSTPSSPTPGCGSATSRSAHVTKIERQGWHALVTMRINGDVDLPANATAKVGQTSLLGSQHIELAPPTDAAPQGRLHDGSLIPLSHSAVLPDHRADAGRGVDGAQRRWDGPGAGHHRGVQHRVPRPRAGSAQPDRAAGHVHRQRQRPDRRHHRRHREPEHAGRHSSPTRQPVLDKALKTIPDALAVLNDERENLAEAADQLGKFGDRGRQTRSTRPRPAWSRSSRTSGRCWSRWPTPGRP